MDQEYIPFGEEWKKEMMKWRKEDLVVLLKREIHAGHILQKVNDDLLNEVKACHDDITFLHKEISDLKKIIQSYVELINQYNKENDEGKNH